MAQRRRKPTTSTTRKKAAPKKADPKKLAQSAKLFTSKPISKTNSRKPISKPSPALTLMGAINKTRVSLAGTPVTILDIPWEAQMFAKSLGVTRHPALKVHLYEGNKLPFQLEPYRSVDYSFERWIEDELNGRVKPVQNIKSVMKPRPHQVTSIRKIENAGKNGWRGFLLADGVGLGKTISAIFGAYLVAKNKGFTPEHPAQVLITAPKSALPHWRNTIKACGIKNLRIVAINYEQTKKLLDAPASAAAVKKTSTANKHTAEKGKPAIQWDIIIADEAHKMKNASQRTAAFTKIARYSDQAVKAPFVIWASATIGQHPLELGYLSPIVGQLTGHKNINIDNWGDWLIENRFNVKKSKAGNFSWVKVLPQSNPSDIALIQSQQRKDVERLGALLFDSKSPSIRRNAEDISGWPKQTYTPTPLQLTNEGKKLYDQAWQEFRKYIGLNPRGKNPSGGLAATMRFRQKASLLSAIPTAEFVNDLLENGLQIAISVEFLESLDVMKDYLEKQGWSCAEISGRPGLDREQQRLKFQKGEAQVMLFTVLEAISLHAGEQLADGTKATSATRAMVVHDIRYSALDMTQIIGRTTRDGELANAYLMFTEGTVEPKILEVVLNRMRNMKTLSGDDEATFTEIESILDSF